MASPMVIPLPAPGVVGILQTYTCLLVLYGVLYVECGFAHYRDVGTGQFGQAMA